MNFLCRFVPNYVELSKGFTFLLNKWIPFIWDEVTQKFFDALKNALVSAPLLHPPNYHHDYFLYFATTDSTIAMVLIQDDDDGDENVIYYLTRNLFDVETRYAHVEKMSLVVVDIVQRFQHYILL